MKGFALLVLIVGYVALLSAQADCNLSISGKVIDEHNRQPLSFAEVYIEGEGKGAVVDSAGNYVIQGLCEGEYTLTAHHVGCRPVSQTIKLRKAMANVDFYLEHHLEMLEEARITASKSKRTPQPIVQLDVLELESARGQSVGDALGKISGVSTLTTGNSIAKPVIHGLYGNRIVTINNGVRQEDQQWGMEHGITADLYAFDEVSVIKGPAAVEYGAGAVGGVVRLDQKPLPFGSENLEGNFYLIGESNGLGGSASAEVEEGIGQSFAYRLQVSGKRLGDRMAPNYVLSNTGVEELNSTAEVGYRTGKYSFNMYYSRFSSNLGILRASHIGSLSDRQRAIDSEVPLVVEPFSYEIRNPRQQLSHDLAKLEIRYRASEKSFLEAIYSYQYNTRREFDIRRGKYAGAPANALALSTHNLKLKWEASHAAKLNGKYGLSAAIQENTNIPGTGRRPILPNYNQERMGVFAVEELNLDRWILEAGLRFDYQYTLVRKYDRQNDLIRPEFAFPGMSASFGATHYINEELRWSSYLAYAYRPPHVNELMSEGIHHGTASLEYGDSSLLPEESLNWSNTLAIDLDEAFSAEITAYLNPFKNYIYLEPQPEPELTVAGAFPLFLYTQANAVLGGLDLDARYGISDALGYRLSGSFVRGYNLSKKGDLILMPPPQLSHAFRYALPLHLGLGETFLELAQKLVGKQNHYPENQDLAEPPEAYQLLDFSVTKNFYTDRENRLQVSLGVKNLLNKAYRDYLDRFRYYADNTGINIMIKLNFTI